MNKTPNYQLNQWEAADKVQRTDFNADNATIDAAIKAEADARTALAGQVAKCGNCRIWSTTYVGTGEYGQDHPTTLTFPKKPLLAMIESSNGRTAILLPRDGWMYNGGAEWLNHLSWNGSTASWYIDPHTQADAYKQLNGKMSYWVLALLAADQ